MNHSGWSSAPQRRSFPSLRSSLEPGQRPGCRVRKKAVTRRVTMLHPSPLVLALAAGSMMWPCVLLQTFVFIVSLTNLATKHDSLTLATIYLSGGGVLIIAGAGICLSIAKLLESASHREATGVGLQCRGVRYRTRRDLQSSPADRAEADESMAGSAEGTTSEGPVSPASPRPRCTNSSRHRSRRWGWPAPARAGGLRHCHEVHLAASCRGVGVPEAIRPLPSQECPKTTGITVEPFL
jgi:hypothetical protein